VISPSQRLLKGFVLAMALFAVQPALAQDALPRFDVFGGFSYLPANGDDFPRQNSKGFQAALTANVKRWFGVVADLGGQYSSASWDRGPGVPALTAKTSVYQYLFGPRFTMRADTVSLFAHALVGSASGNSGIGGFSDSGFTLGSGGGVDIGVSPRLGLRVQFDWLGSFQDMIEDNTRLGIGMVVRLGGS
jgi:Outer membrane protein beta-barrel domain